MKFFRKYLKTAITSLLIASLVQVTVVKAQESTATQTTEVQTTQPTTATTQVNTEPMEFTVSGRVLSIDDTVKLMYKPMVNGLNNVKITFPSELEIVSSNYYEAITPTMVFEEAIEPSTAEIPKVEQIKTEAQTQTPATTEQNTIPVVENKTDTPNETSIEGVTEEGTEVIVPDTMPLGRPNIIGNEITLEDVDNVIGSSIEVEFIAKSLAHGEFVITGYLENGDLITKTIPLEVYLADDIDLETSDGTDLKNTIENTTKSTLNIVLTDNVTLTDTIDLYKSSSLTTINFLPKKDLSITSANDKRHFTTNKTSQANRTINFDLNGVTLKAGSGGGYSGGFDIKNAGSLYLSDVTLENIRVAYTGTMYGAIHFDNTNLYGDNIQIYGTTARRGILVYTANVELNNCIITDCNEDGVYVESKDKTKSLSLKITNSKIYNNGKNRRQIENGIWTKNQDVIISNSEIYGNSGSGLLFQYYKQNTGNALDIDESSFYSNGGKGISAEYGDINPIANVKISNSQIYTNKGGGVKVFATKLEMTNSQIYNNDFTYSNGNASVVGEDGGGLQVTTPNGATLTNVNINNNKGKNGGGIYHTYGKLNLNNSIIKENSTTQYGGGGIYSYSDNAEVIVNSGTEITGNIAKGSGGGISAYNLTMNGGLIQNNQSSATGGGIQIIKKATIDGAIISKNKAGTDGGGIDVGYQIANVEIKNSSITDNMAKSGYSSSGNGGGISIGYANLTKLNIDSTVTFSGNTASGGYGLFELDRTATTGDSGTYNKTIKATKFSNYTPSGAGAQPKEFDNGYDNYDISYKATINKFTTKITYVEKGNPSNILKEITVETSSNANPIKLNFSLKNRLDIFEVQDKKWAPVVEDITPVTTITDEDIYATLTTLNQEIVIPCDEVINTFQVAFNSNGGSPVEEKIVAKDSLLINDDTLKTTRGGYVFDGWYKESTFKNKWDFGNDKVTSDITLYAKWKRVYTVSFDSDGGSPSNIPTQNVVEGDKASNVATPTKNGYTFVEWRDGYNKWDFGTIITSNKTLKAYYVRVETFVITFNTNGGSVVSNQTKLLDEYVDRPTDPTRTGYRFINWTLGDGTTEYDFNTKVTGNLELYAQWLPEQYNVRFDLNGGVGDIPAQIVDYGGLVTIPNNPTKANSTFTGWRLGDTYYNFDTPVTGDIILIAVWDDEEPPKPPVPPTPVPPTPVPPTPVPPVTPTEELANENNPLAAIEPIPVEQNGNNYTVKQNPENPEEYFVFDENGTPLGSVLVPEGKTIDNMDIESELVPLGVNKKENPKTGDINYLLFISVTVTSLIVLVYIQKKLGKEII